MQGLPQKHSSTDAARDIYLEFSFFDGVMVDCSDMGGSQNSALNSSSAPCTSPADEILRMTIGTGGKEVNCSSDRNDRPKRKDLGDCVPRKIIFPTRNAPCMSSLGIHMCDCEDDSLDCNLVTCVASPLDSRNTKIKGTSRGPKIPDEKDLKENEDKIFWWYSGEKHGNSLGLKAETPSLGISEGYRQNGRASGSDFGGKSALAAWAALVSDGPRRSSMSLTGSVGVVSPKKSLKAANDRQRLPTLAAHLELTGTALSLCKLHHDYGENIDVFSPMPSTSLPAPSTITNSIFKREFTGLKLSPGNLCVSDPAPYGTLHGLVHCTLKNGLPNYTFLLDDYEEVVTAKIWMQDVARGKEQGSWRYSFYSLRGETKKKGKSGWKHWRRKDKLGATLVGKMKISSTLCSDEKHKSSVKSECILFSARLSEPAAEARAEVSTQASSSLFETEPLGCKDAACTVCSISSTASASLTTSSDPLSHMSSPVVASASQNSSPCKSAGVDIAQRSKQVTPKWNLCSGLPSIGHTKAINASTHVKESLPESSLPSSNQRHSELAAIIVNVPLEMVSRPLINEQHQQASITVVLPSGNHGRPLCDLKGPSPLIKRWKEGGKCDCKGWDLGCGLVVLHNSTQKPKKFDGNEGHESQRNDDENENRCLRLYKQDGDQDDVFLRLAPQSNGLVALDFHAPLSPLQAFAMAVAILHGRDSNGVLDTHERKLQGLPAPTVNWQKDWDGLHVDTLNLKQVVNILVDSSQQTPQPQDSLDIRTSVLNCASELALPFERV